MDFRHNAMNIRSIEAFLNIRGTVCNNRRDVYFVRSIGEMSDMSEYIKKIDLEMKEKMLMHKLTYARIGQLPRLENNNDLQRYSEMYDSWNTNEKIQFRNITQVSGLLEAVRNACVKITSIYTDSKEFVSDTMAKNLITKLLFWLDSVMANSLSEWNEKKCIKVLADNVQKEHEYLFYLFLTFLGCDVLLIENRKDVSITEKLLMYSNSFVVGSYGNICFAEYSPECIEVHQECKGKDWNNGDGKRNNVVVIPEHPGRKNNAKRASSSPLSDDVVNVTRTRTEKTFEELAQLASSIVLIAIHDRSGAVIGTGSGIMVGTKGYILTNNHVASGGCYYSVRIEDDDEIYTTHEVIKYNSTTDLAIIRINRRLAPLKIYDGKTKLVRGQKVVAIGSPLGLFNSVSDGIISGFRNIKDVDMIQFTAPISHGSSGGAVLNMYGEVIGISTAGIDDGQNINLAVGYENIRMFVSGFMS